MTTPRRATRRSPSSRPIRGCRSSIPSPRRCSASIWCSRSSRSPAGATLGSLGLAQAYIPKPRGYAMQLRVNMEVMDENGGDQADRRHARACSTCRPAPACASIPSAIPATGPAPPSIRCSPRSSCIRPAANWADVVQKAARTLREFRIGGVATNIPFLAAVLAHPDFVDNRISTGFIDTHVAAAGRRGQGNGAETALIESQHGRRRRRRAAAEVAASRSARSGRLGRRCRRRCRARSSRSTSAKGDLVRPGQQIAVLESMKMEHLVTAPHGGKVTKIAAERRRHADAGRGHPVSRAGRGRRP